MPGIKKYIAIRHGKHEYNQTIDKFILGIVLARSTGEALAKADVYWDCYGAQYFEILGWDSASKKVRKLAEAEDNRIGNFRNCIF